MRPRPFAPWLDTTMSRLTGLKAGSRAITKNTHLHATKRSEPNVSMKVYLKYRGFRLRRLRIGNLYAKLVPGYRVNKLAQPHMHCAVALRKLAVAANDDSPITPIPTRRANGG